MNTVKDLYTYFNSKIPQDFSCSWDNDGPMVIASEDKEVKRVLFTLDVTDKAIDYAIANNVDLIISHHPLIFSGMKNISGANSTQKRVLKLIKNDISTFSFHTRLDKLDGGVNDQLVKMLGLKNIEKYGEDQMGRVGTLPKKLSNSAFIKLVKEKISENVSYLFVKDGIKKVAVLGGGGKDYISAAASVGADVFLTGELNYHTLIEAEDFGVGLIEVGHFESELFVKEFFKKEIEENFKDIEYSEFIYCPIKH